MNRFFAWTALAIAALVGLLRATSLRWWQLPLDDPELSASVAPSLTGGDWVLLWNLTRPKLGDLVVCPDPDDPTNVVIGRIAAEANAEVVINGLEVTIDGTTPDVEYNCTERQFSVIDPDSLQEVELYCDMENLGDSLHMRGYGPTKKALRKHKKKVESGRIFLLSDNRLHPFDSRHFGTLDRHSCRERVFFRLVTKNGFFDTDGRFDVIR